jgi:hypothetical protein
MKIKLNELRKIIREVLTEFGPIRGGLRKTSNSRQQYKIGKVEDPNRELTAFEANELFPGSVDIWCEIVPELWPDAPLVDFDPRTIKSGSVFFKEGNGLSAAFATMPELKLAEYDPVKEDWIEIDFANEASGF